MKNGIIISSFLIVFGTYAQDVTLQGVATREVDKAQRLSSQPVLQDTVIPQPMIEYPLLSMQYETSTEVERIEPASIKIKDNLDQLYSTYIKVGVGTEMMPLGEVYWNSTRSRKYIYGAHVKHLSS